MPRLKHSPILGTMAQPPNPDDREDDELPVLDDDLDLGDPTAGTSYGREGKQPDDSGEPVTKGELRELLYDLSASFDRKLANRDEDFDKKLDQMFQNIVSFFEHKISPQNPTKRLPASPKSVDTGSDKSPPVSLHLGLRQPIS
jgi:hypothetical protein